MELYQAYTDYFGMMELIEALFKQVAQNVLGTMDISYQGEAIHLGGEWPRMTMKEAVKRYAGVDFDDWQSDEDARQAVDVYKRQLLCKVQWVFFRDFQKQR